MVYDQHAASGSLAAITHEELWLRIQGFLEELVPVAEQAGVALAAHPDDPPMSTMRQQPRLVYQPDLYQRLLDIVPSRSNQLELCVGTLGEMTEGDVYQAVDRYSQQGKIRVHSFAQCRRQGPLLPRDVYRRGRHRYDPHLVYLKEEQLLWRDLARSHTANDLFCALACGHGTHHRLYRGRARHAGQVKGSK